MKWLNYSKIAKDKCLKNLIKQSWWLKGTQTWQRKF